MFTGTVNPTKCSCPFALKMSACQLLLEITTFLRETFPCLPRPRTEPLVVRMCIYSSVITDQIYCNNRGQLLQKRLVWLKQLGRLNDEIYVYDEIYDKLQVVVDLRPIRPKDCKPLRLLRFRQCSANVSQLHMCTTVFVQLG